MHEWDERWLQILIDEKIEENALLEYKAAEGLGRTDRKKCDITKDVSAMANSAGGIIIYGVREVNHLPIGIDPIDGTEFTREWLEHITGQIQPRLTEIRIHPIRLATKDRVAYAIEIPQGKTAYQANDFRYYRRYNFEAVPMEDYQVRDIMRRKTDPIVDTKIRIQAPQSPGRGQLIWTVKNEGDVIAQSVCTILTIPTLIAGYFIDPSVVGTNGSCSEGNYYSFQFSNLGGGPLFPRGEITQRLDLYFVGPGTMGPMRLYSNEQSTEEITFKTYADEMKFTEGRKKWTEIIERI